MANNRARAVTFEFSTPEIALDDDGFGLHVVDFDGLEAIQRPFQFELNLASRDPEIDFSRVVNGPGKLEIVRHDIAGSVYHRSVVHGLVTDFQQGGKDGDQVMYRATLRPRLWALSLTRRSRIFSNRSVPEILREVMDEHEVPHEISLKATYPSHETIVQHHETDLAFFTRLATKDGIRFTFRHDDAHDTVVLSDAPGQDPWIEGDPEVLYKSHDGLVADKSAEETVVDAFLRERTVPGKVSLQDYNYRTPSAGMDSEDDKSDGKDKRGHHQVFGQHYKDADDGKRLARVRREELHALAKTIAARTVCTRMRGGHRFTLAGHYRKSLDGDYLVACVRHRGGQAQDVGTGGGDAEGADYENWIGVVPAAVPYRPASATTLALVFVDVFVDIKANIDIDVTFNGGDTHHHHHGGGGKMFGLMTATIGGGGAYSAVDGSGSYCLNPRFPENGGSTHAARQVQPYTGAGEAGFHFATEAGNEVIYACLDGDPDRPVILGPVPNPDHGSPVTSGNSSQHIFRTTHDNEFLIDDLDGKELIRLYTPRSETALTLGLEGGHAGAALKTKENIAIQAGNNAYLQAGGGMVLTTWDGTSDGTTGIISGATPGVLALLGVAQAVFMKDSLLNFDSMQSAVGSLVEMGGHVLTAASAVGDIGAAFGIGQGMADGMQLSDPPGILATAKGNIDMVTKETFNVLAKEGFTTFTLGSATIASVEGIDLITKDAVRILSQSDDIQLTANSKRVGVRAKEDIEMISEEKDITGTAKNNIKLTTEDQDIVLDAKKRDFKLTAKKKVLIEATDDQMKIDAKGKSIAMKAKKSVMIEGDTKVTTKSGRADTLVDKGGKIVLKAGTAQIEMSDSKIEFKLGPTKIKMSATGIEISGPQFKATGKMKAEISAPMLSLKGQAMAELKAGVVMIN